MGVALASIANKKKKNNHDYTNESTKQVIDVIKRQTHSFENFRIDAHERACKLVRIFLVECMYAISIIVLVLFRFFFGPYISTDITLFL